MALNTTGARLVRTWRGSSPRKRRRALLTAAMLLAFAAQLPVWLWVVDDAAISFTFARNLADGEGLVAQPGGERVEGYSNPLWVMLLAAWEIVGVDGFVSSKLMGVVFGSLCIPLAWAIARWSRPDRDEVVPLLAAFALASHASFAIWNTSGLENSLFNLLLAAGIWRVLIETRTRGFPWSALLFVGVATTRPEGALYAAVAAFATAAFALRDGRGIRPVLVWSFHFLVPFLAYYGARFAYFAWAFPNTYYAKLGRGVATPFDWNGPGWIYLRDWAGLAYRDDSPGPGLGQGYLLPVFVFGVLGAAGRRGAFAGLSVIALGLVLLFPGPTELEWWPRVDPGQWLARAGMLDDPESWLRLRIGALIAAAIALPWLGAERPGGRALALCCWMTSAALGFAVYSRGDWMHGYRWLALSAVPISVLFAAGVGELRDALQRWIARRDFRAAWAGPALVAAALASWLVPQVRHMAWFTHDSPTSTSLVALRVAYVHSLMDTLALEDATVLDMDMGGHLFWSRADVIDMAGLIDVPVARHGLEPAFNSEYLFHERRPHFAHAHDLWAERSRVAESPEWHRDYILLPGYLSKRDEIHPGDHVRRDLLFLPSWSGSPGPRVTFRNGVTLEGWDLPDLATASGSDLVVRVGLSGAASPISQLEIFLARADRVLASQTLVPGYGWLGAADWPAEEVFQGRLALAIPDGVTPGRYDLGFRLRDDHGRSVPVAPPSGRDAAALGIVPREPAGASRWEIRLPSAIEVVSPAKAHARHRSEAAALAELAAQGDCVGAEAHWRRLRPNLTGSTPWLESTRPQLRRELAECWTALALRSRDRAEKLTWLERARVLDHRTPSLRVAGTALGSEIFREGKDARARESWEEAYRLFTSALRANPSLAWARRYAEEARSRRLEGGSEAS